MMLPTEGSLTQNGTDPDAHTHAFSNLFPAIVQCFAIICGGYLAGRAHILSVTHSRGVGIYVSKFALPALLFKSMCELNLHEVNWKFLAGVLIAKSLVFLLVAVVTVLVVRPLNVGKSGLYAIFSTQSNDFALGYPIVQAVYGVTNPELLKYIYLVAPISLVFLNPIGFLLLELHKWRSSPPGERHSKWRAVWVVVKGVVTNPVVFMTALGVMGNFAFKEKVPPYISNILQVLGDSYSATALFFLGLSMVGKLQGRNGTFLLAPAMIITAKTLLLPFVTRETVTWLDIAGNANETRDLANYGFLYGTFPTAPSVFLYASYYGVATDVVSTGLVACTFLSAPLMYVSAMMITMPIFDKSSHRRIINDAAYDTSILSVICCMWTLAVFILSRRWRGIPHQFTFCLTIFQSLASLSVILWHFMDHSVAWQHYLQFTLLLVGVFAARCFTAVVALALLAVRCHSLCLALRLRPFMYFYGIGLPVFLVGLVYMVGHGHRTPSHNPAQQYGMPQMVISLILLLLNIGIITIGLVCQQRYDRMEHQHKLKQSDVESSGDGPKTNSPCINSGVRSTEISVPKRFSPHGDTAQNSSLPVLVSSYGSLGDGSTDRAAHACSRGRVKAKRAKKKVQKAQCTDCTDCDPVASRAPPPVVTNIEDIIPFPPNRPAVRYAQPAGPRDRGDSDADETTRLLPSNASGSQEHCVLSGSCTTSQQDECSSLLKRYNSAVLPPGDDDELRMSRDEFQITRHLVLIMVLLLSMLVGFFLCIWRLMNELGSGIYVEIEFLDNILNFGQGLFLFGLFGLDQQLVIEPFLKRWRQCRYGSEKIHIPDYSDLDPETRHHCEQFIDHHRSTCIADIVGCKRYRFKTYKCAFTGKDLVDWLIEVGLTNDREDGIDYGRQLLTGQVIEHVTREQHFHDLPYLYQFVENSPAEACTHPEHCSSSESTQNA